MARPSKLTNLEWEQIGQRLLNGEKAADLAREFGVSKTAISTRFSKRIETVKEVGKKIAETEQLVRTLPIPDQIAARAFADDLKAISMHLAGAAKFGAATSHRLAGIANAQVDKIDDADPLTIASLGALKSIAILTDTANKAAEIPVALLKAHKGLIDDLNKGDDNDKPPPSTVTYVGVDASKPA